MKTEMKDSGIDWIGEIPKHWGVTMLKRLLQINNGADYKSIESDSGIPVIGSGGQFAWAKEYMYDGEVVLLGRKGTIDRPLYYKGRFWAVDTMFYSIPTDKTIGKYAYYQSNCLPFKLYSTSTALPSMTQTILGNMNVVLPPKEEQSRIANFLDKKCAEIDELIALQEQMIAQLTTYKQAVITETVTKGLDPNVKMKDSGVEWIGEIPEHWEIRRIKYIGKAENGLTYGPSDVCDEDQGILVLRSSNIQNGKLSFDDNVFVKDAPKSLIVNKGDIIICSRNGSASLVGKSALVTDDNLNATFGAFMMRFRSGADYIYTNFLLTAAVSQYKQLFTTTTVNQLTIGMFGNLAMPYVNDLSEQQSIANYLDQKCKEIDELISIKKEKIEQLKAYKKSVIYEYVTGKKQVEIDNSVHTN